MSGSWTFFEMVVVGCAATAGTLALIFLLLVLRRYLDERRARERARIHAAITRSYLRRVAGHRPDADEKGWTDRQRLAAISQVQALLRGDERDRLMQIAEFDGLLASTVRRSHRWRRSERVTAIRVMQRFGSELCIARLRELMARDRSQRVRLEAAFALAAAKTLPPPRETMRILRMADRAPSRLDIALLRASASDYREQLALLLEDDLSPDWEAQLIESLGWSGDVAIIPLLEKASQDDEPEIRCAALRASAKLGHPGGREWVVAALQDHDPNVRAQAVNTCAALGLHEAIEPISHLLDDPQVWVRLRAEQALATLGHKASGTGTSPDTTRTRSAA